MFETMSLAL